MSNVDPVHPIGRCASVVALDLTPSALATLHAAREARGILRDWMGENTCSDVDRSALALRHSESVYGIGADPRRLSPD